MGSTGGKCDGLHLGRSRVFRAGAGRDGGPGWTGMGWLNLDRDGARGELRDCPGPAGQSIRSDKPVRPAGQSRRVDRTGQSRHGQGTGRVTGEAVRAGNTPGRGRGMNGHPAPARVQLSTTSEALISVRLRIQGRPRATIKGQ